MSSPQTKRLKILSLMMLLTQKKMLSIYLQHSRNLSPLNCYISHETKAIKETGKEGRHSIDTLEIDIGKEDNRRAHSLRQANATVDF